MNIELLASNRFVIITDTGDRFTVSDDIDGGLVIIAGFPIKVEKGNVQRELLGKVRRVYLNRVYPNLEVM